MSIVRVFWKKIAKYIIKDYEVKCMIRNGAKIGQEFSLGDSYVDPGFLFLIEIGNNVTLSHATILAHDGSTQLVCNKSRVGKVKIGSNVFIGYQSIILPNVRIGNNVVIGAGSVVTDNIPSNSVAVGNPCRVIDSYDNYKRKTLERLKMHPVYPTYHAEKSIEEIQLMQKELDNDYGYDE